MNRAARKRAAALIAAVASSAPAMALACPYCAGRADGGSARLVLLGAFIALPFALVWIVWRVIRAEAIRAGDHPESGS